METVRVPLGLDDHSESVRDRLMTGKGETLANRNVPNDPVAVRALVRAFRLRLNDSPTPDRSHFRAA